MLDLTRLQIFLFAAETLSFSEAANQLHLSQPTVSHHIKTLERDLSVVLFDRSSRKLKLTVAGRSLLPRARKLLRESMEVQQMMDSLQVEVVGNLRIACSTTTGKYVLPQFAARFHQRHPGVTVSILRCTPSHVTSQLLEEDADLGVVSFETTDKELDSQEFFTDHIVLISPASHPWASRKTIEPSELIDTPIILREVASGTNRVLMSELGKHDISREDLNGFLEMGNSEAIVKTVEEGFGVAFVSRIAAACELERGVIKEVTVATFNLRRKIFMVRKKIHPPNRAMEAFWGFVHDPANKDLLKMAEA